MAETVNAVFILKGKSFDLFIGVVGFCRRGCRCQLDAKVFVPPNPSCITFPISIPAVARRCYRIIRVEIFLRFHVEKRFNELTPELQVGAAVSAPE